MPILVYIDSDVIISSEIKSESKHKESKKFIKFILDNKDNNLRFYTSIFTFLELASAMIRRTKNKDKTYSLLYRAKQTWKNKLGPLPPISGRKSFTDLIDTLAETAIKFRTTAGDTIHAHTIAENDMKYVITWNTRHFKRLEKKLKGLTVLTPVEIIEKLKKLKKEQPDISIPTLLAKILNHQKIKSSNNERRISALPAASSGKSKKRLKGD